MSAKVFKKRCLDCDEHFSCMDAKIEFCGVCLWNRIEDAEFERIAEITSGGQV